MSGHWAGVIRHSVINWLSTREANLMLLAFFASVVLLAALWVAGPVWALAPAGVGVLALLVILLVKAEARWLPSTFVTVLLVAIAVARLLVPAYRRPVGGTIIWGAILVGIGLGNLIGVSVAWPLILIAIGVGLLLRGLLRGV